MDENQIFEKLGFEDYKNARKSLNYSLNRYRKGLKLGTKKDHIDIIGEVSGIKDEVDKLRDNVIFFIKEDGKTFRVSTILYPTGKVKIEDNHSENSYLFTNSIPIGKKPDPQYKDEDYAIHRGHLLGKQFKDNIFKLSDENRFKLQFFSCNNKVNIYPQFKHANCNRNNGRGQQYYEMQLKNIVNNSLVYYEVEAVFREKWDNVPIGNRLLAFKLSNNLFVESDPLFHVFIPNYGGDKDYLARLPYSTYKEFYEKYNWDNLLKDDT